MHTSTQAHRTSEHMTLFHFIIFHIVHREFIGAGGQFVTWPDAHKRNIINLLA